MRLRRGKRLELNQESYSRNRAEETGCDCWIIQKKRDDDDDGRKSEAAGDLLLSAAVQSRIPVWRWVRGHRAGFGFYPPDWVFSQRTLLWFPVMFNQNPPAVSLGKILVIGLNRYGAGPYEGGVETKMNPATSLDSYESGRNFSVCVSGLFWYVEFMRD